MTSTPRTPFFLGRLVLALLLVPLALPARGETGGNRLLRVQIRPHAGFTRITLLFAAPPECVLSGGTDRVRLLLRDTGAPSLKRLRSYSDPHVGGVYLAPRGEGVELSVPLKEAGGAQVLSFANPCALALEVGPGVKRPQRVDIAPGREPVLAGAERFVSNFSPVRSGLPFVPTDAEFLKRLLPENELLLFQQGESALYKEQGAEALEIFSRFLGQRPEVQALARYRQGEALYLLERYDEALKAFREGERLWPQYLDQAPELLQCYAEVRSRGGDFPGGRALLSRLVRQTIGTSYCPTLLNRLAELYAQNGSGELAASVYRTVEEVAPGSTAAARARLKLADRTMFSLSRDRYLPLLDTYRSIYRDPGNISLRDEALFKIALLQGLYGPARDALAAAADYQTRYPRGIFAAIVKDMREEILVPLYRELLAAGDQQGLARLALENREYLARCLADPDFAPKVAEACAKAGLIPQELSLFEFLSERSSAAGSAPFILARLADDAATLGNFPLAGRSARAYLSRFPGGPSRQRMHERLGQLAYLSGDLKGVPPELSFLNGAGKRAELPESDYYLGKALCAAGDPRGGERALARFGASGAGSPLLVDGFYTLGETRVALKEYAGALASYRDGLRLASGETAGQYLYRMGELYLKLGMVQEAKQAWEGALKKGGSGTWGKLASQSLDDLSWRLKIAGELR